MPLSAIFQLYHDFQFLLGEEAGVPGENPRPAVGKLAILVNYDWSRVNPACSKNRTRNLSVDRPRDLKVMLTQQT